MLRQINMYFHPLILESHDDDAQKRQLFGGIAIVAPPGQLNGKSALICTALADDIILHMFMARELYDLYFNEPKSLMNIDINVHTGAPMCSITTRFSFESWTFRMRICISNGRTYF